MITILKYSLEVDFVWSAASSVDCLTSVAVGAPKLFFCAGKVLTSWDSFLTFAGGRWRRLLFVATGEVLLRGRLTIPLELLLLLFVFDDAVLFVGGDAVSTSDPAKDGLVEEGVGGAAALGAAEPRVAPSVVSGE